MRAPVRFLARLTAAAAIAGIVAGCGLRLFEQRDPWRAEAEARCLSDGLVRASAFTEPLSEINGEGTCGMTRPFRVLALQEGQISMRPEATLACPIIPQLQGWMDEVVQPAAWRWFGMPVVEIKQISAYSCRSQNGQRGAPISEHAFGNALDIAGFRLADERMVSIKEHWTRGTPEDKGFLREVHAGACERFATVLGPGSNMFHYDHLHVDLARRQSGRTVCNPAPQPLGDLLARAAGRAGADALVTGSIRKRPPRDATPIDMVLPGGRPPLAIPGAD